MQSCKIVETEKTSEGFKDETTRKLSQKVIEYMRNLEACAI